MKFVPREIEGNVNISKKTPLKEFFYLAGGFAVIVVAVYVLLGLIVNLIIPVIPHSVEQIIGNSYLDIFNVKEYNPPEQIKLQKLVNELKIMTEIETLNYTVHIVSSSMINAMALPGGNIVVFSGLLDEVKSDKELIFILAHELGHFANKDHLRAVGRSLVFITMSTILLGSGDTVSKMAQDILVTTEYRFSKNQETKADKWALDAVNKKYGEVTGAIDFFDRLKDKNKRSRFEYFFSTHPFPEKRIKDLEEYIKKFNT
jgi:predicted Zn-dependent protease